MQWIFCALTWLGNWIFDFQSLIVGCAAFGIAWYALRPVYGQLRTMQIQSAIATREVLLDRFGETTKRRQQIAKSVGAITSDFRGHIYKNDPEGEPVIEAEWAHMAEQVVAQIMGEFERQRGDKADTETIDDKRDLLLVAARDLERCLGDIHYPQSVHLDDPDYNLSAQEIEMQTAALNKAAEAGKVTLVSRIAAVAEKGNALDEEFQAAQSYLQKRIRQLNKVIEAARDD
jgi:hypothetical protein